MRVTVLALDLTLPVQGRGDEDYEPPAVVTDPRPLLLRLLADQGHAVELLELGYGNLHELDALTCDVAFNLCDGVGRDGFPGVEVLELLEANAIPFTGLTRSSARSGFERQGSPIRVAGASSIPSCRSLAI